MLKQFFREEIHWPFSSWDHNIYVVALNKNINHENHIIFFLFLTNRQDSAPKRETALWQKLIDFIKPLFTHFGIGFLYQTDIEGVLALLREACAEGAPLAAHTAAGKEG